MYYEMNVFGIALDTLAQRPVILLKTADRDVTLPIWVSGMEVAAIAAELVSRDIASHYGRPDLTSALLDRLGLHPGRIAIDSIREAAPTARIFFDGVDGEVGLDVRPGEAVAAALKFSLPLQVAEEVLTEASRGELGEFELSRESESRRYVEFLDNLDPAAMGKYPM